MRRPAALALALALALGTVVGATLLPGIAGAASPTTVKTKLREFKVTPTPKVAKAGDVKFSVTNKGGVDHELVIVRGEASSLPLATDGSVDEDEIPATDAIGEVEDVEPKKTKKLTAEGLTPGTYTLFCNVVQSEDGTTLAHFAEGMYTTFTVR